MKTPDFPGYLNQIGTPQNWPMPTTQEVNDYLSRRVTSQNLNTMKQNASIENSNWRHNLICARLRVPEGHMAPFQHMSTAWVGEKVFVFVVQKETPVVLEDTAGLFPSDTLITALRLLIE